MTTRIDKETARRLDAELATMTDEERSKLSTEGNRILKAGQDPAAAREYARRYMVKYRARLALATRRGLIHGYK